MAFQFPASPIVGDEYTPISGVTYRWNGTGWAPISTTFATIDEIETMLADYVPQTEVGAAEGVAELDSGGQVPIAQLPAGEASGVASLDASAYVPIAQLAHLAFGQCIFLYNSASECLLIASGGDLLTIDGVPRKLTANVSLANSALGSNDTTYYVYAYWTGSAIALEVSTTGYTSAYGATHLIRTKSGDTSRTLVGMVRKSGGNFLNARETRLVRSYFNDRGIGFGATLGLATNITAAAWTEVNASYRAGALIWSAEQIEGVASVSAQMGSTAVVQCQIGMDGAGVIGTVGGYSTHTAGNVAVPVAHVVGYGPAEGYHYFQLMSGTSGGTHQAFASYSGFNLHTRRVY